VQAAIAATTDALKPRRAIEPPTAEEAADHAAFVADFQAARDQRRAEETPEDRYARWKSLRDVVEAGGAISAESRDWFDIYPTTPEFIGQRMVEEELGSA
jgi:hypothetical protein